MACTAGCNPEIINTRAKLVDLREKGFSGQKILVFIGKAPILLREFKLELLEQKFHY